MFYFAYKLGNIMLGLPVNNIEFEASFDWIQQQMEVIWQPFLLGCFTLGVSSGVTGFISIRILWRLHIVQYIKQKRQRYINKEK